MQPSDYPDLKPLQFPRTRHQSLPVHLSNFKWDPSLSHKDIEVDSEVARRVGQSTDEVSVSALMATRLEQVPNVRYKWSLRIKNKSLFVGAGICLQKKAQSNNFEEFSWDMLGHGHYIHGSAGGIFSSSDKALNNRGLSFALESTDILDIQYSPMMREIEFVNNETERFKMKVDSAPEGDYFRPCVYLNRKGDCVEIVRKG